MNIVGLVFLMLCIGSSLLWPFLFCYFATRTTERIARIAGMTFSSNWFDYPTGVQKYVVLIIARSQVPSQFTGLGLFDCTLAVFGKVQFFGWNSKFFLGFIKRSIFSFAVYTIIVFLLHGF